MYDVTWLVLKTTGITMHEDNFKEESTTVCLVGARIAFQISSTKFIKG